jgi:SAM-dependent methyltransferase
LDILKSKTQALSTGCICWDSVVHLASFINALPQSDGAEQWLELGCGVGLLGLLVKRRLILSDHSDAVVENARFNSKEETVVVNFDWKDAEETLQLTKEVRLDDISCVVGADVVWGRLGEEIARIFVRAKKIKRGIFCLDTTKVDGILEFFSAMNDAGMRVEFEDLIDNRFLLVDFCRSISCVVNSLVINSHYERLSI